MAVPKKTYYYGIITSISKFNAIFANMQIFITQFDIYTLRYNYDIHRPVPRVGRD